MEALWLGIIVLSTSIVGSPLARAQVPAGAPSPSASREGPSYQEQLKASVAGTRGTLGDLEKWQAELFEKEVLPSYLHFIRDYRPSGPGSLTVDVDVPTIKNFLAFHAPSALKRSQAKLWVVLRSDRSCQQSCKGASDEIRKVLKERLGRRGFKLVFKKENEASAAVAAEAGSTAFQEHYRDQVREKDVAGALIVQWGQASDQAPDPEHPEDVRYWMRAYFVARPGSASSLGSELVEDAQVEIGPEDGFGNTAGRLLTEVFTQLGGRLMAGGAKGLPQPAGPAATSAGEASPAVGSDPLSGADSPPDELTVELLGFKDYTQYSRAKEKLLGALQPRLRDGTTLNEIKLARGRAVFTGRFKKSAAEARKLLQQGPAPAASAPEAGVRLVVAEQADKILKVEVR